MGTVDHPSTVKQGNFRAVAGIVFIMAGGLLFLDRYLKTGWLSLFILPAIGFFLYVWGIRARHLGAIVAGGLLSGVGIGSIAAWGTSIQPFVPGMDLEVSVRPLHIQIGLLALFTGVGWAAVAISTIAFTARGTWWALIPAGILGGLGACLLFTEMHWFDFVFYLALGTGLPLLFWGLVSRLFGLVIPGSLLITIGTGIYMAWQTPNIGNALVQTGIMLVWFSGGWFMISLGGRYLWQRYIWWPLIPGSILAVVGVGLYIGGDPSRALGFIGNTGSIALMIFGLYLLLMRKSIHH